MSPDGHVHQIPSFQVDNGVLKVELYNFRHVLFYGIKAMHTIHRIQIICPVAVAGTSFRVHAHLISQTGSTSTSNRLALGGRVIV